MKKTRYLTMAGAFVSMLILIFDSRTAIQAAREGVELCLYTLIPSLFPFFIVSMLMTASMAGMELRLLRPLGKLCRIPKGCESLLAIGFLGGYPVGAQNVTLAHEHGEITRQTARRMLAFCNNAGPAFLFGMISPMFSQKYAAWILWAIHILSAVLVSRIIPGKTDEAKPVSAPMSLSISQALEKALRVMACVCGWVIVFRMLIGFLDRWLFWAVPKELQVIIAGILELSNGCIMLKQIENEGLRFLIASVMLAFGGICVTMQTASVSKDLDFDLYFPGKLLQVFFSFLMAAAMQPFLPGGISVTHCVIAVLSASVVIFLASAFRQKTKKAVAF